MKVRHKRLVDSERTRWTLLEESETFYICRRDDVSEFRALAKVDYEPIPPVDESHWQDVTQHVEVKEQSFGKSNMVTEAGVFDGTRRLAHLVCGGDYRLRKVELWRFEGGGRPNELVTAFLVERKVG